MRQALEQLNRLERLAQGPERRIALVADKDEHADPIAELLNGDENIVIERLAPAEALCIGIVQGLYRARNTNSDGALGWAVDFPIEEAGFVVEEFLKGCRPALRKAAQTNLMQILTGRTPEWGEALKRVVEGAAKQQG